MQVSQNARGKQKPPEYQFTTNTYVSYAIYGSQS